MKDLNTCNYEKMSDREACFNTDGRVKSCGSPLHCVTVTHIIASKNNVELKSVTMGTREFWELYIDGEFLNRFTNLKIARSMWKDFSC